METEVDSNLSSSEEGENHKEEACSVDRPRTLSTVPQKLVLLTLDPIVQVQHSGAHSTYCGVV